MKVGSLGPAGMSQTADGTKTEYVAAQVGDTPNKKADEQAEFSREDVDKAVAKLNKTAEIYNHQVKFTVHDKTHRVVVQVIDKNNDTIISESPPKQILDMVAQFQEMVGMLFDKKA